MKGAILGALCGVFLLPVLAIAAGTGVVGGIDSVGNVTSGPVPDIPAGFLRFYQAAGARYRLPWELLAAIGKVECDHGRDPDPSCTHEGAENYAGAGGPMQFLASTWATYGVDGNGDGRMDRWDPADAIPAAARYLRASGAPRDLQQAIYAYNHSSDYASQVLALMQRYQREAAAPPPASSVDLGSSSSLTQAVLSDPRIALRSQAVFDVRSGRVDPRLLDALVALSEHFELAGVGPFITGHSTYVAGTNRISNHAGGRAVDIGTINGQLVDRSNLAARRLTQAAVALPVPMRPDEIESPFGHLRCAPVRCIVVTDHVHLGYDR